MKVGWVRFNQAVELDYWTGTSTGLEERISFVDAFLKAGIRVYMFTNIKGLGFGPYEENKNFVYSPNSYRKCDVLFVESGTSNMNFLNGATGRPWIRDAMNIVDQHKGIVLWYYNDPLIPFPFKHLANAKYPWGHRKNGYCSGPRGDKWTTVSGWGTKEELFDGKINVILSRSKKFSLVRQFANSSRCGYKDLKKSIKMSYFPMAIFGLHRDKFKVRKNSLKYELVYCGGDRSRRLQFRRLYCDLKNIKVDVWGNWRIISGLSSGFSGPMFHGRLEHFWNVNDIINRSLCTCQISPEKSTEMGWVTHRPFEAMFDKSIALSERNVIHNAPEDFIDEKYLVGDSSEIMEKIKWLRGMTLKERKVANEEQLNRVSKFTFEYAVDNVVKIWEKYRRLL